MAMPRSRVLLGLLLTSPAYTAVMKLEKLGSWFQAVSHYPCGAGHQAVSVSYEEKVKLFEDHALLSG
jgi:hypothetical protein